MWRMAIQPGVPWGGANEARIDVPQVLMAGKLHRDLAAPSNLMAEVPTIMNAACAIVSKPTAFRLA
jgi:hypothetical protein